MTGGVFAMSSTNYIINTDSINFGGTENSSDGLLLLSDTLGEVGTGFSSSSRYAISAGYRTLQSSYISISAQSDIVMPSMSGLIPGESTSSGSWIVTTDNMAGYQMTIASLTSPALKSSGASFSDYVSTLPDTPDFTFFVPAASSTFGFSPEGEDISQDFLDDGADCGIGSLDSLDACWIGLSTGDTIVSERGSSNHPDGSTTTIRFRAGIGSSKLQDAGVYTATLVITAVTL